MLAKLRSGICKKILNKPVQTKIEPVSKLRTDIGMKRLDKPVLNLAKKSLLVNLRVSIGISIYKTVQNKTFTSVDQM